jgi:RHS repeat-associated protein
VGPRWWFHGGLPYVSAHLSTGIGANAAYSYIGTGTDRYNKTVSGTTTQFLYDEGSVDEEMQGTTVTADYSAGAEKLSGTLYWMLQDGQGSTRRLLNSSQATVASYTTDAYGNSVASSGSAANPFQWNGGSGYYSDSESGLQKVGARFYEPSTGRWISQDSQLIAGSAADSQALNRYLYCGANPIGLYDPDGHGPPAQNFISMAIAIAVRVFCPDLALEWLSDIGIACSGIEFWVVPGVNVAVILAVIGLIAMDLARTYAAFSQEGGGTPESTIGMGQDGSGNTCVGFPNFEAGGAGPT